MNLDKAVSPDSSPPFLCPTSPNMAQNDEGGAAKPAPPRIQLQVDEPIAQGTYSNLVVINHSENEFILDFAYLQPANPLAKVRARVISSPRHTKRLLLALQKNLQRYEERYGVIELSGEEEPTVH
jgi:Protein of unknown function (DUF3467)